MSEEKSVQSKGPPGAAEGAMPPDRSVDLPQGAEAPPKGVRAAAIVRWVLLLGVAAVAVYSLWEFWGSAPGANAAHQEDRYYCPMHTQIRAAEPGECPICHMSLVPIPEPLRHPAGPSGAQDGGAVGPESPEGLVPVTLPPERQQLAGIASAPVTRRAGGATLRVPGVVEASEGSLAQVHVRTPGFIERIGVRATGVQVARGEALAWVYSPQIYQVEVELLTAHRWAQRDPTHDHGAPVQTGIAPPGAPPASPLGGPTDVEAAARQSLELLGVAAADVAQILRSGTPMRAVPIRAPQAGYVTARAAVLGLYAQPETVLYEIADLSRLWVVASVYERDLAFVRRGMPARFLAADSPDPPIATRVDLVEPLLTASTRTARLRLVVANPRLRLRPGQYGDVELDLPASSALVVPRDAVIDTGRQQHVFVVTDGQRFEPRRVRVGAELGDQLEVLEGLREGERVVTRAGFMVDSESRLAASLAEAPSADAGGAR